jgi:hypothetical protein
MRHEKRALVGLLALIGSTACTGRLTGPPGGDQETSAATGAIGNGLSGDRWKPGEFTTTHRYTPTALITSRQYANIVKQAFGDEVSVPELPADEASGLKRNSEGPPLTEYNAYINAALDLGIQLAPGLASTCDFNADAHGCVTNELGPALNVLYRNTISVSDIDPIAATVEETKGAGIEAAIAHGVAFALLNPRFLYRFERTEAMKGEAPQLPTSEHELAARLSFTAWHAAPDAPLFERASRGQLSSSLSEESSRVFASPVMGETIWQFVRAWLQLSDSDLQTDPLKLAMMEETRRFVQYVLVEEQAPFEKLFTANYSFINAELAEHYGVAPPTTDWEMYEFPDGSERHGILTHGSFLSANSAHSPDISLIFRGKVVFEHLFCGTMPPPPEGAAGTEVASRLTTAACAGCHTAVDPMGQFFDRYDEYGAIRPEGTSAGTVDLGSDIDQDYPDTRSFLDAVSQSRAFYHCFVSHWFRTTLGRELGKQDQASFDAALQVFEETRSLRSMLEALARTDAFSTIYPKPFSAVCE